MDINKFRPALDAAIRGATFSLGALGAAISPYVGDYWPMTVGVSLAMFFAGLFFKKPDEWFPRICVGFFFGSVFSKPVAYFFITFFLRA